MVRWLGLTGLAINALDVVLSHILARWVDRREAQAALPGDPFPPGPAGERYPPEQPLWIDFVADTGDGWRSTYSVAWLMCRALELGDTSTEVGRILVLGGDEVYPLAKSGRYRDRLIRPFEIAARQLDRRGVRDLFAIPGNHDWYDGLKSFMRLFGAGTELAAWKTPQTRSYFAVQLPHRYWLIGIDIGFGSHLNASQLEYFRGRCGLAEDQIRPGDRVILCTPRPTWSSRFLTTDPRLVRREAGTLLEDVEHEILETWRCELPLVLSGDLHHYSRYATADGSRHWVTAGGGGAYLYPTRGLSRVVMWSGHRLHLESAFPEADDTEHLRRRLLVAPFLNPPFLWMVGTVHLLMATAVAKTLELWGAPTWEGATLAEILRAMLSNGGSLAVLGFAFLALLAYADGETRPERTVAALLHSALNGVAMVGSTALATWAAARVADLPGWMQPFGASTNARLTLALVAFGAGAVLSAVVFGSYLRVQELRDRHMNDALAALHVADWKSFVRLQLGTDASLTLYPVGVQTVARRRPPADADDGATAIDPEGLSAPGLIEGLIVIVPPSL